MQCSTGDLHEEISDFAAPRERDTFEDPERAHEAVFAEIGEPSVAAPGGKARACSHDLTCKDQVESLSRSLCWNRACACPGRSRRGRDQQVEGRFISNINAFGRCNGFRHIRDAIFQQREMPSRYHCSQLCFSPLAKTNVTTYLVGAQDRKA